MKQRMHAPVRRGRVPVRGAQREAGSVSAAEEARLRGDASSAGCVAGGAGLSRTSSIGARLFRHCPLCDALLTRFGWRCCHATESVG